MVTNTAWRHVLPHRIKSSRYYKSLSTKRTSTQEWCWISQLRDTERDDTQKAVHFSFLIMMVIMIAITKSYFSRPPLFSYFAYLITFWYNLYVGKPFNGLRNISWEKPGNLMPFTVRWQSLVSYVGNMNTSLFYAALVGDLYKRKNENVAVWQQFSKEICWF